MNSRQRLLAALEGRVPDHVPISAYELCGFNSRAFENNDPSYKHVMDAIRARTDCVCMWNPDCNATLFESSRPADIAVATERDGNITTNHYTFTTPKGRLTRTTRQTDNINTIWQTEHWCKYPEDVEVAMSHPFEPVDYDFSDFQRIAGEVGDKGIIMASLSDPLLMAADLMEFGEYTIWVMTETEHFARTVELFHERNMENLRRMLDAGMVDLYRIVGPEYATPPFLPPRFFRRFIVPYIAEMAGLIHLKGAKVRLHCHGRVGQVLSMILDTGADALDPCEAPPDGDITLAEIKSRTSGRLCLFGNIQLKTLEHGTEAEVEKQVKDCMTAAREGGAYVIMPTAAPINSPLSPVTERNYLRFISAASEFGVY
ncbi:MAG: uroporphyrinogen decarboxylase family protein [bacterium]|nr:hypothetical protein [Candidatus Sumerlaeota bacterium]